MKTRLVKSTYRSDPYIEALKPELKLLYIYLFTNEYVDMCGVYEISLKRISNDLGYSIDTIGKNLDTLSKSGRVYYYKGWVYLTRFQKHQNINSPKIKQAIERSISLVPKEIIEYINGIDTSSIPYGYGIATYTYTYRDNLDLDLTVFVEKWNSVKEIQNKKGLPKVIKITDEIKNIWNKRKKSYTFEEIKQGVNNYCIEISKRKDKGDGYFEHRFTLMEFLEQKNGLAKFINLTAEI